MSISANQVLAINYQNSILEQKQIEKISKSQISAAKLLQDYVTSYKSKINEFHKAYNGPKSTAISNFNFQTSNMYAVLQDIQEGKYSEEISSKLLSDIVNELKVINTRMKIFLEQEKTIYLRTIKEKQKLLSEIWMQISETLDNLLLSVSNQLIEKKNLSKRDKKVVEWLIVLRIQNNKMKEFQNLTFETHEEMNNYIRNIIEIIRLEFIKMKNL